MKYQIVVLDEPILIVEGSVKKEDGYCWDKYHNKIISPEENLSATINDSDYFCKIIGGIEDKPHLDFTKLSKDELINIGYVNVEKEVFELLGIPEDCLDNEDWDKIQFGIECFKQCKKLFGYSKHDVISAYYEGGNDGALFERECGDYDDLEIINQAHINSQNDAKDFIDTLDDIKIFNVEVEHNFEKNIIFVTKILYRE